MQQVEVRDNRPEHQGFSNGNAEEPMKTPPLTSSPVESGDVMDMSPLPHKHPFSVDDALETPTRDNSMTISSSPPVGSPMESATTPFTPRE